MVRVQRLGDEKSVALEWTLQDMVEDLALLYNTLSARAAKDVAPAAAAAAAGAAGGGGGGDQQDREAARFDRMQVALSGFADALHAKQLQLTLMQPAKRDFLAKMLAIKGIVTAGNANFVYGERPPWAAPVFLPPLDAPLSSPQQYQQQPANAGGLPVGRVASWHQAAPQLQQLQQEQHWQPRHPAPSALDIRIRVDAPQLPIEDSDED